MLILVEYINIIDDTPPGLILARTVHVASVSQQPWSGVKVCKILSCTGSPTVGQPGTHIRYEPSYIREREQVELEAGREGAENAELTTLTVTS